MTAPSTALRDRLSDLQITLDDRGRRYGEFTGHAAVTQAIKRALTKGKNWTRLADDQREAVEMIAHKLGRILNGDPDYHDSWHDIAGYAELVANRVKAASASGGAGGTGTPAR